MFIPQITPIPPINVVVQQPPGAPIWVTTLFSTSLGFIFGLATNLITDYLKHFSRVRKARRRISRELMRNLEQAEAGERILKHAEHGSTPDQTRAIAFLRGTFIRLNSESFDHLASSDVELMLEIDESKNFKSFYQLAKGIQFPEADVEVGDDYIVLLTTVGSMVFWGRKCVEELGMKYEPEASVVENMYDSWKRLIGE